VASALVSGNGLHYSRAVSAGPLIFFGTTATSEVGVLADEAQVPPPYHVSPAARSVAQGTYVYDQLDSALRGLDSGLGHILQVEQFTPHKMYADGYITTRAAYLREARPTTALCASGELLPDGAVICTTGVAVRPGSGVEKEIAALPEGEEGGGIDWGQAGDEYAGPPPYNDVVVAGPYVFVTGDVAVDPETGDVDPAAKVPDWLWVGSEARNEARVLLRRLGERMERVGGSLADAVHITLFVTDIADIFEIDRAWRGLFGDDPPARTIIPVRGVGVPRREAPGLGHGDRAVKLEQQARALRPGRGVEREVVVTPHGRFGHAAEAIRAGEVLWISEQYASSQEIDNGVADEVAGVMRRVDEVCVAAGSRLQNLAQLRVYALDAQTGHLVHEFVEREFAEAPPVVCVTSVPGPLLVPGANLFVDAVAHVPGGNDVR
jgi:enamine deaminase RidA (YjgF/YER057c/UK114 family)